MHIRAKRFYFVMIGTIVLSFGAIIGALYWGEGQLQQKASTISDLQANRDILNEKITVLKKSQDSVERIDEAQALLDELLPTTKKQENLIADVIYFTTAEAGIPINQISTISFAGNSEPGELSGTVPLKEISGVYVYPFTVTVEDITYETLLVLLKEIETNGRLVQVDDLQINPDKATAGLLSSVNLTMKAFLKP